ncbi:hypothetical protein KFL_005100070 [Klebsormidium nitens]|uniref:Uncharacterized protein n=1 Tax=Klebsormidium nitens TaxID=105231 RepID=A0A1Y1IKX9_KLENI|nr:hypothetical protein KFL_005100070 [Klebsormidium nitens]|eukprot:GAQ89317.1 hypothetical protein KFL_005100070 [Klebsormidium nitens]
MGLYNRKDFEDFQRDLRAAQAAATAEPAAPSCTTTSGSNEKAQESLHTPGHSRDFLAEGFAELQAEVEAAPAAATRRLIKGQRVLREQAPAGPFNDADNGVLADLVEETELYNHVPPKEARRRIVLSQEQNMLTAQLSACKEDDGDSELDDGIDLENSEEEFRPRAPQPSRNIRGVIDDSPISDDLHALRQMDIELDIRTEAAASREGDFLAQLEAKYTEKRTQSKETNVRRKRKRTGGDDDSATMPLPVRANEVEAGQELDPGTDAEFRPGPPGYRRGEGSSNPKPQMDTFGQGWFYKKAEALAYQSDNDHALIVASDISAGSGAKKYTSFADVDALVAYLECLRASEISPCLNECLEQDTPCLMYFDLDYSVPAQADADFEERSGHFFQVARRFLK